MFVVFTNLDVAFLENNIFHNSIDKRYFHFKIGYSYRKIRSVCAVIYGQSEIFKSFCI